jgi:hypothetical protein
MSLTSSAPGWAYTWDADRDHWLDACARRTPAWSGSRRDIVSATAAAADRAREQRFTHFLYPRSGRFVYASNPPREGTFFSVTVRGDWSLHQGRKTYPQETAPDASSIAKLPGHTVERSQASPARLAQADRSPDVAAILPFRGRDHASKPQATRSRRRL